MKLFNKKNNLNRHYEKRSDVVIWSPLLKREGEVTPKSWTVISKILLELNSVLYRTQSF